MKIIQLIIFISILTLLACGQSIPMKLAWDYDYCYATTDTNNMAIKMTPEDSALVEFRIYRSYSGDTFDILGETLNQEHEYYLLQHENLYNNVTLWFYATAYWKSPKSGESVGSDTIQVFFPMLEPGKVVELKVIKIGSVK